MKTTFAFACARSIGTPGLRRPKACSHITFSTLPGLSRSHGRPGIATGCIASGTHASGRSPTVSPKKLEGITPITETTPPRRVMALPSTSGVRRSGVARSRS
jgi:hypothetical protein